MYFRALIDYVFKFILVKISIYRYIKNEKGALIQMDGIVAFIVGTLIGVAIHSYIKKRKE